jgi:hypothetical protein
MKKMILAAVLVLLPTSALASVGKVVVLEGKGTRTPDGGGAPLELKVGTEIELKDTLRVSGGNLKFELNDGSQIALGDKSELFIDDAQFEGADCKSFLGTLKAGSLWTHVKKLLGGSKYEVKTERAVAGVRGTIFRIDADTLIKAAKGRHATVVRVTEGLVRVNPSAKIAATMKGQTKAGDRKEVPGPKEISSDEWEAKFVELAQGQDFAVGADLWENAKLAEAQKNDAFAKWLDKNGK